MERSSYQVREGGADVTACVRMVGQSSIYNTLYFSTVSGSAGNILYPQIELHLTYMAFVVTGSPSDFSPIFELLTFEPFSSNVHHH